MSARLWWFRTYCGKVFVSVFFVFIPILRRKAPSIKFYSEWNLLFSLWFKSKCRFQNNRDDYETRPRCRKTCTYDACWWLLRTLSRSVPYVKAWLPAEVASTSTRRQWGLMFLDGSLSRWFHGELTSADGGRGGLAAGELSNLTCISFPSQTRRHYVSALKTFHNW